MKKLPKILRRRASDALCLFFYASYRPLEMVMTMVSCHICLFVFVCSSLPFKSEFVCLFPQSLLDLQPPSTSLHKKKNSCLLKMSSCVHCPATNLKNKSALEKHKADYHKVSNGFVFDGKFFFSFQICSFSCFVICQELKWSHLDLMLQMSSDVLFQAVPLRSKGYVIL